MRLSLIARAAAEKLPEFLLDGVLESPALKTDVRDAATAMGGSDNRKSDDPPERLRQ